MKYTPDPLDAQFSLFIRARDGWTCQLCGRVFTPGDPNLHNSHFQGRRKEATRFDPKNCVAVCGVSEFGKFQSCHEKLEHNPGLHKRFFLNRLGKKEYDALILRANTGKIPTREEIKKMIEEGCPEESEMIFK